MNEPAFTPAVKQARLIREKRVSTLELVDLCYSRIERLNPTLSAFTTLDKDRARAAARRGHHPDPRRRLRARPPLGRRAAASELMRD